MLTYTFSLREKVLLAILTILLVAIAWFKLVYEDTSQQLATIDAQIQSTKASIEIERVRLGQQEKMRQAIERYKAAGAKSTPLPTYDNIRPLMAELDRLMAQTESYTLTFDELDTESSEYVLRGVGIQFGCDSYEAAEAVVTSIAEGTYPCVIDTVTISDSSTTNVRSSGSNVSATVHASFLERKG